LGAGQLLGQGHNCDSGSSVVSQRQFRGALIAQPEEFDATRRPGHFAGRDTDKNFGTAVQAEELSLMQIKKRGRAARVGAFGDFCLLSGEKYCLTNPTPEGSARNRSSTKKPWKSHRRVQ
jgi:hypothetical protein